MNIAAVESRSTAHPYLDGKPKRLLIDNQWVEAASGKTFATIDPGRNFNPGKITPN